MKDNVLEITFFSQFQWKLNNMVISMKKDVALNLNFSIRVSFSYNANLIVPQF